MHFAAANAKYTLPSGVAVVELNRSAATADAGYNYRRDYTVYGLFDCDNGQNSTAIIWFRMATALMEGGTLLERGRLRL